MVAQRTLNLNMVVVVGFLTTRFCSQPPAPLLSGETRGVQSTSRARRKNSSTVRVRSMERVAQPRRRFGGAIAQRSRAPQRKPSYCVVRMGSQLHASVAVGEGFEGEEMKGDLDELRGRLPPIQKQFDFGLDHLQNQGLEIPTAYFQSTKEAYEALLVTLSEMEPPPISCDSGLSARKGQH